MAKRHFSNTTLYNLHTEIDKGSECARDFAEELLEESIADVLCKSYSTDDCEEIMEEAGLSRSFLKHCITISYDSESILNALCEVPRINEELQALLKREHKIEDI
jgi:hypothetical protein